MPTTIQCAINGSVQHAKVSHSKSIYSVPMAVQCIPADGAKTERMLLKSATDGFVAVSATSDVHMAMPAYGYEFQHKIFYYRSVVTVAL